MFELTLKRAAEKAITFVLLVVGVGLFGLGAWAAIAARGIALAGGSRRTELNQTWLSLIAGAKAAISR